ncbi:wiskott-Aldrich syndrome protein homolog 1-like isoform X2 [Ailuropoda melanoleuca]|uniref:wiskott-Aldrich syndrome protein homolog 1-like isoform X2 n=1 Tax=Ailuropoda melanoleuca TaxID=9646 RepID=UPI000947E5EF|nr:wiskott-Aldrich syndrome protein homolog 1-like isoform X2 [Ailuropoda melanoleuca]
MQLERVVCEGDLTATRRRGRPRRPGPDSGCGVASRSAHLLPAHRAPAPPPTAPAAGQVTTRWSYNATLRSVPGPPRRSPAVAALLLPLLQPFVVPQMVLPPPAPEPPRDDPSVSCHIRPGWEKSFPL